MRSSGAVLREVKNAAWSRRLSLIGRRYEFAVGRKTLTRPIGRAAWSTMSAHQELEPVCCVVVDGRAYWWFEGAFYWEDEQLDPADVLALVRDRERRRQRKLERAHTALALDREPVQRRQPIPREVRRAVYERDGGGCVECGETFDIQYDHIIPVAMGGATTVENLQLLCAPCNQGKGASLG
jgi:5-methylcytosine-specific restriction endonuclease McrA